jgi:CysZ protein
VISRFAQGVGLLAEGMGFLRRQRRLWPLALVPVLFAMIGVASAAALFWAHLEAIHQIWVVLLPALEATQWWSWIWVGPGRLFFWSLGWLAVVLSFAVSLIAGLLIANLASAPFLDQLSQRVEAIVLGPAAASGSEASSPLSETLGSYAAELKRLGFLGGLWLVLTLVGFGVPGAQLVTGPLLVVATILFLPLEYAGFALDRRRMSFGRRRRWLWSELPTMIGFGGVAFAACLIPGLNLLILPSLVVAGTLLVLRAHPEVMREGAPGVQAPS